MARKENDAPAEAHWEAVDWTEKLIAFLFIVGGIAINQGVLGALFRLVGIEGVGNPNGMGWLLVGAGLAIVIPPFRPLLSKFVNAVPGLPNK